MIEKFEEVKKGLEDVIKPEAEKIATYVNFMMTYSPPVRLYPLIQ